MVLSFFETFSHDSTLRLSLLLNLAALTLLLIAFGFSYRDDMSSLELTPDDFSAANAFALVSPTRIRLTNAAQTTVCPQSDAAPAVAATVTQWLSCEAFMSEARVTLAFDGLTFVFLVIGYFVGRYWTRTSTSEDQLLRFHSVLQVFVLSFHALARVIFDAGAVRSAISFLRINRLSPSDVRALPDSAVGIYYGTAQKLHVAVAACLAGALVLIVCRWFQIGAQLRIDEVELTRECSARLRSDNPGVHPPMRWMLDTRFHPLFDEDELAALSALIAGGGGGGAAAAATGAPTPPTTTTTVAATPTVDDATIQSLRAQLAAADAQWQSQKDELAREALAVAEYSHRIRREERLAGTVLVDDWHRQQQVWEQRKEAADKEFAAAGVECAPKASTSAQPQMQ